MKHDLTEIAAEIVKAIGRGCDRATFIGEGEPMLYEFIDPALQMLADANMKANIITNATLPAQSYLDLWDRGLINHLQLSIHGIGEAADAIGGVKGTSYRQAGNLMVLSQRGVPFRTNTTIQQMNLEILPDIAKSLVDFGAFHVSLLGFLPHYEWGLHVNEVAVHPKDARKFIEEAAINVLKADKMLTIRYHPMCHLSPDLWPYVTNARYVLFDPWEWEYGHHSKNFAAVSQKAVEMGESVAIKGAPCSDCILRLHCGGWNETYARAFGGADLRPITCEQVPENMRHRLGYPGGLFDMNPANSHCGTIKKNQA